MAETSGFFEAELNEETNEWDREYFASQFAAYFRLFFGNGVFGSPTNQLQVIAGEGLKLVIRAGWAFIEGYWYYNDSDLELMVFPNTSAFDRIDSVICRLNVAERRIRVIIAEDTTELIRDGSYYDLKLATVTIGVAATSLSDANIVDTRMDESVCGIVTSVMKIQPTADLFAQFTDMFNIWFEGIKEQLSTDAAGNLQNQIGLLDELHTEDKTSLVNAINELLVRDVDVLDTYEEIMANTTPGKSAGGLGVKEGFTQLNNSLKPQLFDINWTQYWGINGRGGIITGNIHILDCQITIPAIGDLGAYVETLIGKISNTKDKPQYQSITPFISYSGKIGILNVKPSGDIVIIAMEQIPQNDTLYVNMCW